MRHISIATTLLCTAAATATPALAAAPAALAAATAIPAAAATDCAALAKLALPDVTITAATEVAPETGISIHEAPNPVKLPFAVCKVEATARPTPDSDIRLAVLIPVGTAWNGKFVQMGNGGFAGRIPWGTMLLGLSRGYAVAGTDGGHQSEDGTDASWALGHPEKIRDFGWRAVKTTTDTAKAIVAAYGTAAKRNYFFGCSDGGREALMTAQRYPADFDGIVAGAPAWAWTRMQGVSGLATKAMVATGGNLPPAKLPALQAAALKACGAGKTYIADPRACRFDPVVLQCTGAETAACLTAKQVAVVRGMYRGRPDVVTGGTMPGLMPGAEAAANSWSSWGVATPDGDTARATDSGFAWNHFSYLVVKDPKFDLRNLTHAQVIAGDIEWRSTLNADSPDLSAFKARGGKLLGYHGWNDPAIPPGLSLEYLNMVRAKMGRTDDFYRIFMVPGMLHCRGGDAPVNVDWFALLDTWVETGAAPDTVTASGGGATQLLAYEK